MLKLQRLLMLTGISVTVSFAQGSQIFVPPAGTPAGDGYMKLGQAYISLYIPREITGKEWEVYESMMQLSEDQRREADRLFECYRKEDLFFRRNNLPQLWEESGRVHDSNYLREASQLPAFLELKKHRRKVLREFTSLDARFFDSLVPILDDSQLTLMDSVRKLRIRLWSSRCYHNEISGSQVDLIWLYQQLRLQVEGAHLLDEETFALFLSQYEESVTPLCENRVWEHHDGKVKGTVATTHYLQAKNQAPNTEPDSASRARALQFLAERREANGGWVRTALRIRKLNLQYTEMFAGVMVEPFRTQFLKTVFQTGYPKLFPDPCDLHSVFQAALMIEPLSVDQKEAMIAIQMQYRLATDSTNKIMMSQLLEYQKNWAETHTGGSGVDGMLNRDINTLQNKRKENSRRFLEYLQQILDPPQQESIKRELEIMNQTMKKPRDPFSINPPF